MKAELTALRAAMGRAKIDVYVIPTADFHGSEYVGDYFKCRAYVSGFTGSAGTLVVTADWAGLWTDSRYFIQAAQQLEGSGIDLCKMGAEGVPTVQGWLEEHLQSGQTLGFDGRTMTAGTGRAMEKQAAEKGASLVFDRDLVDEIWESRPPLSKAPAWALDLRYTGRTRKDKLEALWADVQKTGADCHILTSLDDIAWLLNIRGGDVASCPVVLSYILMDETGTRLYTDAEKFSPELKAELETDGVRFLPYNDIYADAAAIPAGKTVLADPSKANYAILRSIPKGVTLLEQLGPTTLPKAIKTPEEQENEKAAHIKDGVALTKFMKWLKEHVGKEPLTEISAAEKLESFREAQEHYVGPSFDPIFGYGPHGAIVHYSATEETNAELKPEGLLLADTGGHYLEGSTDVTRTFALGPLTDEMKHHYTLVLRGHLGLSAAKFPAGATGMSLDYIARKPLWDEGLSYGHGTGHGVGYLLSVHEGPQSINYKIPRGGVELKPGMITSNEPGLYLEGKCGIRLENLVLCVEREKNAFGTFLGFENLTMCPFDLDAVVPEEMSAAERKLLNEYHETVYQTLTPYFDEAERVWLREVTRAI